MVIFPLLPEFIAKSWKNVAFFIIFMIICVIVSLKVPEDLLKKTKEIEKMEHKINSLTLFLQSTPERVIYSIFNYLDFGYNERITVYRYADSHFVPVGRYAKNTEFKKGGRKRYPHSEGFIGIAWRSGHCTIEGLPDPEKQYKTYIKEVTTKCNIVESTISEMQMKSRSYYCLNLDSLHGDPIAVIVFESTDAKLPKKTEEIKHLLDSSFGHLIVDVINMNLPPGRRGRIDG